MHVIALLSIVCSSDMHAHAHHLWQCDTVDCQESKRGRADKG